MVSRVRAFFYFFIYIIIIRGLFFFLGAMKVSSGNFMIGVGKSLWLILCRGFMLLRLGGLPPFLGFYPKMVVLRSLVSAKFFVLSIILVTGSVLNLFYYLKLIFIRILVVPVRVYRFGGSFKVVGAVFISYIFSCRTIFSIILFNILVF